MITYLNYWRRMIVCAFSGGTSYLLWILLLGLVAALGFLAYLQQLKHGLILTNMSDFVSWGAYIANFTFLEGVGAASVLIVAPAYLYQHKGSLQLVLISQLLAVAAIVSCLLFVVVDLGRPDRFLHILPLVGRLNFPRSFLAWDVVVLNGYLLLNLHIPGYLLYKKYLGEEPSRAYYLPFALISIIWALGMLPVTSFLYTGLGGRPYWNTAILAPRFLVSAFAAGPAFLSLVFLVIDRRTSFQVPENIFPMLRRMMRVFIPLNLFLLGCELLKEFYTNSIHVASVEYLFFGLHGHNILVPYIWSSVVMSTIAMVIMFVPRLEKNEFLFVIACIFAIVGVWVEKGMGLIIPGFVPSPSGAVVEYSPSLIEILVCAGIWAFGALLFSLFAKVAMAIQTGELRGRKVTP